VPIASFTDDLLSAGQGLASAFVQKVAIDSQLLPQIVIDDPFGPAPAAEANDSPGFMKILKPRVTVYTAKGPYVVAPWGDPGENTYWPLIQAGAALTGALAAYGLIKLLRGGR
jgi:hypothetical protein